MAETSNTGLLDLEKELTCSICTEILHQPLTLLDCLHTFCGSCLKLWFSWQASQKSNTNTNPYTCPSCRASVRDTKHDARATTLLDMFISANPTKAKTAQEKEEISKKYTPGDDVIPKVEVQTNEIDEEDRRMVEEVREMSLREVGVRGPRSYERGVRHRNRSRDSRDERRRREGRSTGDRPTGSTDSRSQARQIEHQSSLRSLISMPDVDSADMQEEILRQIVEEGLLDNIDLDNIDVTQEDELSERIAEAYRRRHGRGGHAQRSRSSDTRNGESSAIAPSAPRAIEQPATRRTHARSTSSVEPSTAPPQTTSSHPPVSRPHLLEAYPISQSQGQRRRTSSEHRRQTAPISGSAPITQAARSATDLSAQPRSSESRERRPSDLAAPGRRATDPRPRRLSEGVDASKAARNSEGIQRGDRVRGSESQSSPAGEVRSSTRSSSARNIPRPIVSSSQPSSPGPLTPNFRQNAINDGQVSPRLGGGRDFSGGRPSSSSSSTAPRPRVTLYAEPSVTCERCGVQNIEYDVHENCAVCKDGNFNLCHRCYQLGKGCLHWYGFGHLAWTRFQQRASADQQQELPHTLISRQYSKPPPETLQPSPDSRRPLSTEDPAKRLQSGAFCSNCSAFASDCFWKCDACNDGEWGFCNRCVNRGLCCTHPLLPVAQVTGAKAKGLFATSNHRSEALFAPITSPRMVQAFPPSNLTAEGQYRPLTFSTNCDICNYPVQPSQSRFHCPSCNEGDYNICTSCYAKLTDSGRIARENGEKGWRRCLRGHRMIVVFFEDSTVGQRRVVVKDLVGGHAMKDEAGEFAEAKQEWGWHDGQERQTRTISKQLGASAEAGSQAVVSAPLLQNFPPDGGVGMRVLATYSYLPREGVDDELAFPKGAEIREAEDINGDWFWGCYAGVKGTFPANHGRVVGVVTM